MATYQLGNILRGYIKFEAPSDCEAWSIGCAKFNEARPTPSDLGRQVELYVWRPIATTQNYKKYLVRDGERSDGEDPVANGWYPVLIGFSKEPFPAEEHKA
jgi:hypothetical protein